jgi:transcriptional regulator with XRE-family HTH domain
VTTYQRERAALGERLRHLRQDARLTGRALAAACDWPPSKVSKIEAGRQTPSDADVDAWAAVCGAAEQTSSLIGTLRSLESHYQEYRRLFRSGLAANQRKLGEQEAQASFIRNFESVFVPGLLQTPAYARRRLAVAVDYDNAPEADLDHAVAARMQRQALLYQPGKKLHVVMTEAVLHYRLCEDAAMAEQLDRLTTATTIPNLRMGVIPFEARYAAPPIHGFWILDRSTVQTETVTADLNLSDEHEVTSYLKLFAELAELAVYGEKARGVIARSLAALA